MPDLELQAAVRPAADAGVLALRVLPDEDHVDGRAARKRRRYAVEEPGRPDVRPQVETLPEGEEQPPQRDVVRHGRMADGSQKHRVVTPYHLQRIVGHHRAAAVVVLRAPRQLVPLEREAERVDDLASFGDDLGPGAVTRDHRDAVCHAASPGIAAFRRASRAQAGSAWRAARTAALCARFAAWYDSSASTESTSPSVGYRAREGARPRRRTASRAPRSSAFTFMSPNPGKASDPSLEVLRVGRLDPQPRRRRRRTPLAIAQRSCTRFAIAPGKRWMAGLSRNASSSRAGSIAAIARRVEVAEPLPQLERAEERRLHGHLLVEREPDQERERVACDERVGLVVAGEVEAVGHRRDRIACGSGRPSRPVEDGDVARALVDERPDGPPGCPRRSRRAPPREAKRASNHGVGVAAVPDPQPLDDRPASRGRDCARDSPAPPRRRRRSGS